MERVKEMKKTFSDQMKEASRKASRVSWTKVALVFGAIVAALMLVLIGSFCVYDGQCDTFEITKHTYEAGVAALVIGLLSLLAIASAVYKFPFMTREHSEASAQE